MVQRLYANWVYFTTAIDMARRLAKSMAENHLHREIKISPGAKLLILDEVNYLPLHATQASLLFRILCQRHEKAKSSS